MSKIIDNKPNMEPKAGRDAEQDAEKKRRRSRIYNIVIYVLAGVLMLGGLIIIINDQTYLFDKLGKWLSGEKTVMPTFPAFPVTFVPSDAYTPYSGATPYSPPATEAPLGTESPEQTNSGSSGGWHSTPLPETGPEAPVCVYFPQYDVICPVDPVGYNWKGQMDTVRAYNRAGWLITSGTPATGGNILIAGHNRYSGKLGYFSVIKDKLQIGDQVIIETKGGEFAYYLVESINRWRYDEVPDDIMRLDPVPRLTLITCYGDYSSAIGSSIHRVIAVCRRVDFGTPNTNGTQAGPSNAPETGSPVPIESEAASVTPLPHETLVPITLPPAGREDENE